MTTAAKIGHGSLFKIWDADASPPDYTKLGEVTSITPPSISRDAPEATHTESPEGWREFIAGLKDAGEASLEINFVPGGTTTARLLALFDSDAFVSCQIEFPDSPATLWNFTAILTGFSPEAPMDDKMSAGATFKITGKPNFVGS